MTDNIFHLTAELRNEHGTRVARRLRHQHGRIPAVVYGAGKAPQKISLDHNEIVNALKHQAFYSHILTISIAGKEEKVVLKDIDRNPTKPRVLHIDFQRIRAKEKLIRNVPIHFLGEEESPGIKAGGILSKHMTEIEISCLPADLPESIDVDISQMNLEEIRHLSDIRLPTAVEFSTPLDEENDYPVVSIHLPKVELEEEKVKVEEEIEEAAATEVETEAAEEGKGEKAASKEEKSRE